MTAKNTKPWFDIGNSEDGTHYVNAYWTDQAGTTRRDTIAEELIWQEASNLAHALDSVANRLLLFQEAI
jgi:hypothetical protein